MHTHGQTPTCGCGIDTTRIERLLDTAALAQHIGLSPATVRSYTRRSADQAKPAARRPEGHKAPPAWWRDPEFQVGNALAWDGRTADLMQAREPRDD